MLDAIQVTHTVWSIIDDASPETPLVTFYAAPQASKADVLDQYRNVNADVSSAVSVVEVKAEAERRILAIMPEYQQRNALAMGMEATQTYGADPDNWPEDLKRENAAVQLKWTAIKAVRAASNRLEALDPIPDNFRDDSFWE